MGKLFYILSIKLYPLLMRLISPFNEKARLWVKGRKNIFQQIDTAIAGDTSKKIWMHCASLGEFEQARPLLEKFKEIYPAYKLLLTFFSPSGYEIQKNNKLAHYTFYLPADSNKNAEKFLNLVKPSLVVFVKYNYLYYYLKQVDSRKISLLLVSGMFTPGSPSFKWHAAMRRQALHFFTHLFVQTEQAKQLLQSIHVTNVSIIGNTRLDRVLQVASAHKAMPVIERFINQHTTIVAGSTWTDDDEVLDHFANTHPELKFIVAPYDTGKERIEECCKLYKHSILYSAWLDKFNRNEDLDLNINTLVIDNVGILKFLYYYAAICYVGGGFGSAGIHNILEAAVYYKPVLFGPAFDNFYEAQQLIDNGGAFDIEDAIELEEQLNELLQDEYLYKNACRIAGDYIKQNAGATELVIKYIQKNRLL
ncbi:MAG TPA: glycosyltransferase N-terminal domain-containing protein [Parafilimonas sp.]|nr:glycosyltransferase N-terminal domain-containing protein [Parafilimonas sp.]